MHVGFRCSTGERVAIKRVDKHGPNSKSQFADLAREQAVLSKSKHPYIVQMLGCTEDANAHYMVMEYIEGACCVGERNQEDRMHLREACCALLLFRP